MSGMDQMVWDSDPVDDALDFGFPLKLVEAYVFKTLLAFLAEKVIKRISRNAYNRTGGKEKAKRLCPRREFFAPRVFNRLVHYQTEDEQHLNRYTGLLEMGITAVISGEMNFQITSQTTVGRNPSISCRAFLTRLPPKHVRH